MNTSNHYSAKALTPADVQALDLEVMQRFYRERFANAADFTYFIVGAFTVDEIAPLLETWVAHAPVDRQEDVELPRHRRPLPGGDREGRSPQGPRAGGQTVMSFFADTKLDELEMHRARAAASLLGIRLRDILREELGGTYGVSVSYDNSLPLTGYGAMIVQFGSVPENIEKLTGEVLKEVERLKTQGPTADDVARVQELERRDLEEATKQNSFWIGFAADRAHARLGSVGITRRERAHREALAGGAARHVQEVLPDRSSHRRDVEAGNRPIGRRARAIRDHRDQRSVRVLVSVSLVSSDA